MNEDPRRRPSSSHSVGQAILAVALAAGLAGCSMFTDSLARSASEMATQNAVKAIREVDLQRQVDVTLIGGHKLNPSRDAHARPVQVCVYLVENRDWRPPVTAPGSPCASRSTEASLIAAERRTIAPGQVQQFQMKAPGIRDAWLVVDADFAYRPTDFVPLSLRVEGHGVVRRTAWLDGNAIYDGAQVVPAPSSSSPRVDDPVGPAPRPAPAASSLPLDPLPSSPAMSGDASRSRAAGAQP